MFFVPLAQLDSVELLVHSLKTAGGEADCRTCPATKVCMKQCLTIAKAVGQMLEEGTLPQIGAEPEGVSEPLEQPETVPTKPAGSPRGKGGLKVIK